MLIYGIWIPYMRIYISGHIGKNNSINVHLRTTDFVYAHLWKVSSIYACFCKCTFMEAGLSIWGYKKVNFHKFVFTNDRICRSTFTERWTLPYMCIYGWHLLYICIWRSWIPYMCAFVTMHLWKLDFVYAHI